MPILKLTVALVLRVEVVPSTVQISYTPFP
jgi:hypothetical protein